MSSSPRSSVADQKRTTEIRPLPRAARHFLLGLGQAVLLGLTWCAASWTITTLFMPGMQWARSIPNFVFIVVMIETVICGPPLCLAFMLIGGIFKVRLPLYIIFLGAGLTAPLFVYFELLRVPDINWGDPIYDYLGGSVLSALVVVTWAWRERRGRPKDP